MPKKKSKPKVRSEVIKIDVMRSDPAELAELSKIEGLDRLGIYPMPDGSGVTFGQPLQDDQHLGEGLPDLKAREKIDQWQITFDIRASFDHNEGKTFLEVAQKGSGTNYSFAFEGLEFWKAQKASGQFNNNFDIFLIHYGIADLFTSYFWQRAEKKDRDEAYEAIIKSFENYFKIILKSKRKREIGTREINPGFKITTFETIETGRETTPEAVREQEKERFIAEVIKTLTKIESYDGPQTILEAGNVMYPTSRNPQKTLDNILRKHHLSWRVLKRDYENLNN